MGVKCQGGKPPAKTELEALSRDSRLSSRRWEEATSRNDGMLSRMWYTQQQTILHKYTRNTPEMVGINRSQLEVTAFFWSLSASQAAGPTTWLSKQNRCREKNAHPSSHLKTQIIAFWQTRQHFSGFNKISLSTNIPFFVDTQFLSVLNGEKKKRVFPIGHWWWFIFSISSLWTESIMSIPNSSRWKSMKILFSIPIFQSQVPIVPWKIPIFPCKIHLRATISGTKPQPAAQLLPGELAMGAPRTGIWRNKKMDGFHGI